MSKDIVMKTSIKQIIMLSLLAFSAMSSHTGLERLVLPLEDGDSRSYQIVYALENRDFGDDATIELNGNQLTISQGNCRFGGEVSGDYDKLEFAFVEGTFSRSFEFCSGAIGDVQMMISDLYDMKGGYLMRSKMWSSEWLVIGWNSASEGKVDLLIGQKLIPNEHSLNPESA